MVRQQISSIISRVILLLDLSASQVYNDPE
jgi:hypothetical protein